jgi:hypothetical protein
MARASEEEAAALDPGDGIDGSTLKGIHESVQHSVTENGVLQHGGDVAEQDARLRKVGDIAYGGLEPLFQRWDHSTVR